MAKRATRRIPASRARKPVPRPKSAAASAAPSAMPEEAKRLWAVLSQDAVTFPGACLQKCMSTANHVIQCHTLSEAADVQYRCMQGLMQDYMNESARLGEMWMQAVIKSCNPTAFLSLAQGRAKATGA